MQKRKPRITHEHKSNDPMTDFGSSKYISINDVYEVSEFGIVRKRVNKYHKDRCGYILINWIYDKDGYAYLRIKNKKWLVHRLVHHLFIGSLNNELVVCHLDGNKLNNHYSNLLQTTQAINISHKKLHGTWQSCENHPFATITNDKAMQVKKLILDGRHPKGYSKFIAETLGISVHVVHGIKHKNGWKEI